VGAEVLKDFLTRLGFEVDEAGAKKFNSALATAGTRAAAFGAAIQAMAVGAYAAIYKIAESKSQLLALADAVDVPVARLEELGFVAEQTGASAEALNSSLEGLTEALGQASIGQGGLETFHRLGISVRDSNGELRNSADLLLEVGEKLNGMDTAKATMFLGQLGIDRSLVRMLTSDVSGLRKTYQDMYQAVGVDSQKAAEDSRAFVGEVKALYTMVKLVGDGLAAIFVGQMGEDVVRFRKLIQENVGKIIPVIKTIVEWVLKIGKVFFTLTARLASWVGMLIDWFNKLDSSTQNLILGVMGFAAAWRWLNLSFLMTPLGMLLTGFLALLALIDDFMVWKSGGKSLIDWGPWAADIETIIGALGQVMTVLGQLWDMVKGPLFATLRTWGQLFISIVGSILSAVTSLVSALISLFQGDLDGAINGLGKAFGHLLSIVQAVGEYILKVFSSLGETMAGALGGMVDKLAGLFGLGNDDDGGHRVQSGLAPILGPGSALAAASAGGGASGTTLNASTVIRVEGASSPEATARRVAGAQDRVNSDLVRHARGAAR